MKFTYFKFKNFKGIKDEILDLSKNSDSKVFTLVGLNESGKTTVLEAINYFAHKPESLEALELDSYKIPDIHNLIPINLRDNFNDFITIEGGLELEESDILEISKELYKIDLELIKCSNKISFIQKYFFKNSKHDKSKDKNLWNYDFTVKKKRGKKNRKATEEEGKIIFQ